MSRDLLFSTIATGNADLVFGQEDAGPITQSATAVFSGQLPGLSASLVAGNTVYGHLTASMPGMTATVVAAYKTNTQRPVVGKAASHWQIATQSEQGVQHTYAAATRTASDGVAAWGDADPIESVVRVQQAGNLEHARSGAGIVFENADRASPGGVDIAFEDAIRSARAGRQARHQSAAKLPAVSAFSPYSDGLRAIRLARESVFEQASRAAALGFTNLSNSAARLDAALATLWEEAERAHPGIYTPDPVTPPGPGATHTGDLLFVVPFKGNGDLVFYPDGYVPDEKTSNIVVPVRRAYIVTNQSSIRISGTGVEVPTYSFSLSLDRNSWTWSFSATVHSSAETLLEPNSFGEPVEVEIELNGSHFFMLAESLSRDRTFPSTRINVSGRGRAAVLADTYSPTASFTNSDNRSAQQLMSDILTQNGVSLGWDVTLEGVSDWNIPAGTFAHTGSYMSAVNAVAAAVGAYVQADPVNDKLTIRPAYPVPPWELASATPDIELPDAAVSREGISWANRPAYNAVYVSGTSTGVLALVRRAGSAGDVLAPMVVDPLITDAAAARQRGISVLGDTGRTATLSLNMQILPETGIIVPGKIIKYLDKGTPRLGISRSVRVTGGTAARQTIEVETHV